MSLSPSWNPFCKPQAPNSALPCRAGSCWRDDTFRNTLNSMKRNWHSPRQIFELNCVYMIYKNQYRAGHGSTYPALRRQRQVALCESEASLVYIVSFRLTLSQKSKLNKTKNQCSIYIS